MSLRIESSVVCGALALCVFLTGCPGRIDDPLAFRREAADSCPSDFDVEEDLFARTCGTLGCHTGGPSVAAAGLDLATAGVGERLLTHVSTECGDRPLLEPGNMEDSLLIEKVVEEDPACGEPMPSGLPPLNPTEMRCLQDYLAALTGEEPRDAGPPRPEVDASMMMPDLDAGPPPEVDAGPEPMLEAVTYQAEAMTLTTYIVDTDGTVIRLPDGAPSGTASATFDGAAGTYQLTVHAVAEFDGAPTLIIRVAGADVATETYPMTDPAAMANEPHVIGPIEVTLSPGDEILLEGRSDADAWARVDRVEVTP